MRTALSAPILGLALALATGCATPAPTLPAPKTLLLAPVSFNQKVSERLEPGIPMIEGELHEFLTARQVEFVQPPLAEFHDTWLEAARPIGSLYDDEGNEDPERFAAAVAALLEVYRTRGRTYDAVLLPYLYLRAAKTAGGQLMQWDGVRRPAPFSYETEVVPVRIGHSKLPATSLRILAFSGDGEPVFDRFAGLEVTAEFHVREPVPGEKTWVEIRARTDLFQDEEIAQDAISVALAPYFGR